MMTDHAALKIFGTIYFGDNAKDHARITAEKLRMSKTFKTGWSHGDSDMVAGAVLVDEYAQKIDEFAMSVETVLNSGMILLWAAIENLAGDLWEAAVNLRPRSLAMLRGTLPPHPSGSKRQHDSGAALSDANQESLKQQKKLMRLEFLESHDFNVSEIMGTIWRRERFNFLKLSSLRDAYIQAFDTDNEQIRNAILDPSFSVLSQVRHVLVHNNGIMDEPFIDAARGTPFFPRPRLDKKLGVNGNTALKLIQEALRASIFLVSGVDQWLANHKK
jgi:hypothetical protein